MGPNGRFCVRRLVPIKPRLHHHGAALAPPITPKPTASWIAVASVTLSLIYSAAPAAAQLDCTQDCRPTVALVPFGSLGSYQLDADGITVAAGDAVVLDVILRHWDADLDGNPLVSSFEIALDSSSLTSGTSGRLSAHTPTCDSMVDCDRQVRHRTRCTEGQCIPAFYDERRPETIFPDTVTPFELAISAVGTRFTVVSPFAAEADTGLPTYAASIILQTSPDATGTFTVKVSELPGDAFLTGTDGSTIPIEVFAPATIHVIPGEMFVPKSRALSFHAGLPGRFVAVRVTFVDLALPFDSLNGTKMWVQEPKWVSRLPTTSFVHAVDPETPGMWVAKLGCTFERWTEWAEFSQPVHIINEAIVPDSVYVLQTLDNISGNSEQYYSLPIRLTTPESAKK